MTFVVDATMFLLNRLALLRPVQVGKFGKQLYIGGFIRYAVFAYFFKVGHDNQACEDGLLLGSDAFGILQPLLLRRIASQFEWRFGSSGNVGEQRIGKEQSLPVGQRRLRKVLFFAPQELFQITRSMFVTDLPVAVVLCFQLGGRSLQFCADFGCGIVIFRRFIGDYTVENSDRRVADEGIFPDSTFGHFAL